ncbi:hypothetical protein AKJ16_DCAP17018 [Drosera capensis]
MFRFDLVDARSRLDLQAKGAAVRLLVVIKRCPIGHSDSRLQCSFQGYECCPWMWVNKKSNPVGEESHSETKSILHVRLVCLTEEPTSNKSSCNNVALTGNLR